MSEKPPILRVFQIPDETYLDLIVKVMKSAHEDHPEWYIAKDLSGNEVNKKSVYNESHGLSSLAINYQGKNMNMALTPCLEEDRKWMLSLLGISPGESPYRLSDEEVAPILKSFFSDWEPYHNAYSEYKEVRYFFGDD